MFFIIVSNCLIKMETPGVFELIDDEHVLLNMGSRKIKIVNLNTMTVEHTFQGKIPRVSDPEVRVISDHNSECRIRSPKLLTFDYRTNLLVELICNMKILHRIYLYLFLYRDCGTNQRFKSPEGL